MVGEFELGLSREATALEARFDRLSRSVLVATRSDDGRVSSVGYAGGSLPNPSLHPLYSPDPALVDERIIPTRFFNRS